MRSCAWPLRETSIEDTDIIFLPCCFGAPILILRAESVPASTDSLPNDPIAARAYIFHSRSLLAGGALMVLTGTKIDRSIEE
jgi:hypothetical protein